MSPLEVKALATRIAADLAAEGLPMVDADVFDEGHRAGFAIRLPDGRPWGFRVPVDNLSKESVRAMVEAYT
jgi:hypothetical protein